MDCARRQRTDEARRAVPTPAIAPAIVWVVLYTIIGSLPTVPAGVYFSSGFSWSAVNYAPLVLIAVIGAVAIWWLVSARHTFKGPVRTIDLSGTGPVTSQPSVAPAGPTID